MESRKCQILFAAFWLILITLLTIMFYFARGAKNRIENFQPVFFKSIDLKESDLRFRGVASSTLYSQSTSTSPRTPKTLTVTVTGYSSTPDQTDDSPLVTAANTSVQSGVVAANFLPLYTRLKIPEFFGDKIFVVEDRMAPHFPNRLDIWFPDRDSATKFGIKKTEVMILQDF